MRAATYGTRRTWAGAVWRERRGAVFADDSNNGNNIAVDAQGLVYVTGTTNSDGNGNGAIKFPVTPQAIQHDFGGTPNYRRLPGHH